MFIPFFFRYLFIKINIMIKGKNISTLTRQLVHESIDKAFNNLIEDKSFQRWKTVFGSYLKQEINELQEN